MIGEQPRAIDGLNLWIPSDSFKQDYNVANLGDTMAKLRALSILYIPGDEDIYVGSSSKAIYHVVEADDVQRRIDGLRRQTSPVMSSLQSGETVPHEFLKEEARIRELNFGLGRTALLLASSATNSADFRVATNDLIHVFSMLEMPIHSYEALTKRLSPNGDLIYRLVQAARKHKAFFRPDAEQVAKAFDSAVLPLPNGKTWSQERSRSFIERSAIKKPMVHTKKRQPKAPLVTKSELAKIRQTPDRLKAEKEKSKEIKTKAHIFIDHFYDSKKRLPYSEKLEEVHAKLCTENSVSLEVPNNKKIEIGRLGITAYLEEMTILESDYATQMLRFISRGRRQYNFPLTPALIIGNLLTAKINASNGLEVAPVDLPGLTPNGLAASFQAIRHILNTKNFTQESSDSKKLGDLVEAYLKSTFLGKESAEYKVPVATDDIIGIGRFATLQGVTQAILERVIERDGIDAGFYDFKRFIGKGLTPEQQELLIPRVATLKTLLPPKGVRSVSGFAHVNSMAKSTIDSVIREHSIPTNLYRFGANLGNGLTIEAQQKILELLASSNDTDQPA